MKTDEILQIANHLRKPDIRYVALPTEATIDRAKGSVRIAWYGNREDTLDTSEIRTVALEWQFTVYAIYLELNEGKRILIGKERKEKVAERLAATIAQFLNVKVSRFLSKTKPLYDHYFE